jgi:hypothetical protein
MELGRVGLSENNLNSPDLMTDQGSSEPVVPPFQEARDVKISPNFCQAWVVCQTPDSVLRVPVQSIHLFAASFQKSAPPR